MECHEDGFHLNYWFNKFMKFFLRVGVRPSMVSLPLVEVKNIIQTKMNLGFNIPNNVQIVVQVQKVLNFK
jgi:hypothetical protein